MRYWWVNQNQTYRQEVRGGYLWSPKRRKNGTVNPYYESMREASPGDLVFSFADTRIPACGVVRSHAYEAPQPEEFGAAGRNWDRVGWRVDVAFREIATEFRPSQWIDVLRPHLPRRYSPLDAKGRGHQAIYLTELPEAFALVLSDLLGKDIAALARSEAVREVEVHAPNAESLLWEEHLRKEIESNTALTSTEREALVLARRGQGVFRERVQSFESHCRITHVDRPEHLRASHCKPWRDCDNQERLDPENGLLLTPSIDHLFDGGYISFESGGDLLLSPVAHRASLARMGVPIDRGLNVGSFTSRQGRYLEYHRDSVFLRSLRRA